MSEETVGIDFDGEVVELENSLRVMIGDRALFLPKSCELNDEGQIEVPLWLAHREGLI